MQAKASRTLLVAWDGAHAELLEEGTVLEGDRAAHAVEQGFAVELGQEKAISAAPANKAVAAAPKNKGR